MAKYLLLQIPGWLLAGAVVAVLHRWDVLSFNASVAVVLLCVIKDLLLFPFVRAAYEGDERQGADRLIGLAGVTTTRLAPDGYVCLRGELWRAELTDTSQRVEQGATVSVCASRGLTLFVAPAASGDDGTRPRGTPLAVVPCAASRQRGCHVRVQDAPLIEATPPRLDGSPGIEDDDRDSSANAKDIAVTFYLCVQRRDPYGAYREQYPMKTEAPTHHLSSPAEALRQALGIRDPALARVLCAFGLDHTCTSLVLWIPAIELAWLDDRTAAKQRRLLDLIRERHHALGVRAEALLREWLVRRPPDALFRTARRVVRAELEALPPDERPAWRARVIGPCADLAYVSRGWLGCAAMSDQDREWLLTLADDLRTPDEQRRISGRSLR